MDRSAPTAPLGRPREARLDEAIAAATLDLLAERGYNRLTLAAVAERAGTTTPAIYRRWRSKADLVVQVVFRTEGDDVIADTGDLETDVRMMVRWSTEKFGNPAGRAAMVGLLGEPSASEGGRLEPLSPLWRRLGEHLASAVARGEVRGDVDPDLFLALLIGPVMFASAVLASSAAHDEWIDKLSRSVLDAIRPAVPPPERHREAT